MQAPLHPNHSRRERPAARDRPAADDEGDRLDRPIVFAQTLPPTSQIERPDLRHLDAAYNLACWLMLSDDQAYEVVQQAVFETTALRGAMNHPDSKTRLMAIVRGACYARLQTTVSDVGDTLDLAPHANESGTNVGGTNVGGTTEAAPRTRTDPRSQINAALQDLSIEFREVIVLRELEDLSYAAISCITGVPVCALMSRLGLARARLAWLLQRQS